MQPHSGALPAFVWQVFEQPSVWWATCRERVLNHLHMTEGFACFVCSSDSIGCYPCIIVQSVHGDRVELTMALAALALQCLQPQQLCLLAAMSSSVIQA
jgi:hypothetical protein